jgi:uncharacterized protein YndB with AHSA1/START domain
MTLKTEGDTHVIVTRRFSAPREAVYRAHTDPQLIQKWLLGPEGWTMPVCINEAKAGGRFRYEWTNGKGGGFHITGEYLELNPYDRIVMSSACTCLIPRQTIISKRGLKPTARER